MTTATLIPEAVEAQTGEAQREAQEVLSVAGRVKVTTPEEYQAAGVTFAAIKAKLKELENQRLAITGPINNSLKTINDMFRRPKEALEQALSLYERPMAAYKREEERKRREAEEAARREEERLRREAEERERQERERLDQIRREEEEARTRAAQADNPMAALVAQQQAERLADQAQEQSQAVMGAIREKVTVTAPVEYVPKAMAAGTAARTLWKFEITDASLIPREYLIPDEKKIGELARTMKEKAALPGVRFFDDIKIGGR